MRRQSEIGLDERQRAALVQEVQQAQSDLVPLQFEMSAAGEALSRLLGSPQVDEAKALAEAERVMKLETQIKRRHLALLIRIKNVLTPEQQQALQRARPRERP
jgi:Spy/CpxP family protein refolding chaperone